MGRHFSLVSRWAAFGELHVVYPIYFYKMFPPWEIAWPSRPDGILIFSQQAGLAVICGRKWGYFTLHGYKVQGPVRQYVCSNQQRKFDTDEPDLKVLISVVQASSRTIIKSSLRNLLLSYFFAFTNNSQVLFASSIRGWSLLFVIVFMSCRLSCYYAKPCSAFQALKSSGRLINAAFIVS